MAINYSKTTWENDVTLVDETRLNNLEDGVESACDELDSFYDGENIEVPGNFTLKELSKEIQIGEQTDNGTIWERLRAFINSFRLHVQSIFYTYIGESSGYQTVNAIFTNYGGDISISTEANAGGDIGKAYYNGNEIATIFDNAGSHNSIYRGKYLGSSYTAEQQAAITDGTFTDLFIGDYWTINGVNYRIAAFDYYLNTGDTACTTHHAVIVPDTVLYIAQMNTSNTTTGGYVGSAMYTTNLTTAKTTINTAFGSANILSHSVYLTNTINSSGIVTNGDWYDCTVDLMSEQMVYGSSIFMPVSTGSIVPSNYFIEKTQLNLFSLCPSFISNRNSYWLKDVVNASCFSDVGAAGQSHYGGASGTRGVRPAFAIC